MVWIVRGIAKDQSIKEIPFKTKQSVFESTRNWVSTVNGANDPAPWRSEPEFAPIPRSRKCSKKALRQLFDTTVPKLVLDGQHIWFPDGRNRHDTSYPNHATKQAQSSFEATQKTHAPTVMSRGTARPPKPRTTWQTLRQCQTLQARADYCRNVVLRYRTIVSVPFQTNKHIFLRLTLSRWWGFRSKDFGTIFPAKIALELWSTSS